MSLVVKEVKIAADAYFVCLHHALTTECEEIMGLLIGDFHTEEDGVICNISSAITLTRSDKRKDRVEISPEKLIEAQEKAEAMSSKSNGNLHIVGWYHSHPHITVLPSAVDLRTQAVYQQMDSRFIGLIYSVFNEDKKTKVGTMELTCFQAENIPSHETSEYRRLPIPFSIARSAHLSIHNQEALENLIVTLFDEQNEMFENSRKNFSDQPLVHLHNSAVMTKNICLLTQLITGPLIACLQHGLQNGLEGIQKLIKQKNHLKKILDRSGVEYK